MSYQLLSPPPIQNTLSRNQKFSIPYQRYLTNLNGTINGTLVPINFVSNSVNNTGIALQLPPYPTTEIDSISNAQDGMTIFDDTLKVPKFYANGVWRTYS